MCLTYHEDRENRKQDVTRLLGSILPSEKINALKRYIDAASEEQLDADGFAGYVQRDRGTEKASGFSVPDLTLVGEGAVA